PTPPSTQTFPLSLHDALPICPDIQRMRQPLSPIRQKGWLCLKKGTCLAGLAAAMLLRLDLRHSFAAGLLVALALGGIVSPSHAQDRKSTRLNSSHEWISYAVF